MFFLCDLRAILPHFLHIFISVIKVNSLVDNTFAGWLYLSVIGSLWRDVVGDL